MGDVLVDGDLVEMFFSGDLDVATGDRFGFPVKELPAAPIFTPQ